MAAILSRQKTGEGVWIDCNLFESQVSGSVSEVEGLLTIRRGS